MDPVVWGLLVSVTTIIVTIIIFRASRSSDFTITVEPFEGAVEKGKSISAVISVEGQKYNDQVKLTTKSQSKEIDISFDPSVGIPSPIFKSTMDINVDPSVLEGDHTIEITSIGSKNKIEHSTNFFLKIKNPPFVPQELTSLFFQDGWMGDIKDISLDIFSSIQPYSGKSCIRIAYSGKGSSGQNWAGIYWLYPNNNWGNRPEGRNLIGATKLCFMAKGETGGEIAEFKIGGVSGKYQDSFQPSLNKTITLTSEWNEYSFDLRGRDLSNVIGGFCWVTNTTQNPNGCVIFLDDIIFK